MKTVLCIAETCCDIIFGQLDRIPVLGEEEYCKYFSIKAGGGSNTAMGLAKLKIPTRFLTRIGDDAIGTLTLDFMKNTGLKIDHIPLTKGYRTPVSAVMSTNKDRCFASFGGDGGPFVTSEQLEREISRADHVHTYLGYCLQYPIVELCKKYKKTLSLDTSWVENVNLQTLKPILSYCSLFTPNDKEAMALTGTDRIDEALYCLAKITPDTVITMGEKGSIAWINGAVHHQESILVGPVVDSTGAGDIYCSGLLYGFIHGLGLTKSMEIASYASGLSVTYYGGIDPVFSFDKFEKIVV